MGNNSGKSLTEELDDRFTVVKRFDDQSITLREDRKDHSEYLVRQFLLFKEDEYKREIERHRQKKLIQDPHVVSLVAEDSLSNVEDMFCSTHHKLYAVYAFPHRNLDQEISERFFQKRRFQEKQIWSILASCILGLAALERNNIRHECLQSESVLLSNAGVIQIADPYCTASPTNFQRMVHSRQSKNIYLSPELCQLLANEEVSVPDSINPYKSDVFTLGMIALEMALLQYQHECYRDDFTRVHWQTIEFRIEEIGHNYSEQLKVMVELMLQQNPNDRQLWSEMQTYIKKSEPVFVESQIVQEPVVNTERATGSNGPSPRKKDRQSIKLQPAQHPISPITKQTSAMKSQPSAAQQTQQIAVDANIYEKILPVQISSITRPKLNQGPSDTYITKAQFDENLMEVSDDQTNELESSQVEAGGKHPCASQPISNKPSEASLHRNASGAHPIIHNPSFTNLNRYGSTTESMHNKDPFTVPSNAFAKTNSKDKLGSQQVQTSTNNLIKADYTPAVQVMPADTTYCGPSYTSSGYDPYRTYSRYEPLKTNLDPIRSTYAAPTIPSSSFSPTFNYPPISTSYYAATPSTLDWISKPAYSAPAPDYKELFTDYAKLGIQKQNTYAPSSYVQPVKIDPPISSGFDSSLLQTKKVGEPYPKEIGLNAKPAESMTSPSPIRTMMNASYTSPINLPKESNSVELSSIRPMGVTTNKLHMPTEPSSLPESQPQQLAGHNRSQSMSKLPPTTKSSTPIYVIDHFKHGARYEGEKVNNLRHGKGKFFYQDGGLYDGDWVRNKMEGHGKLYYKSGKIAYEGQWKDDEFCGNGVLYNEFPEPMTQPFDPRDFDNMEEFWTRFEGKFSKDMKEGKGTLYFTNGDTFTGHFEKDFVEGPGMFVSGGRKLHGVWSNNKLVTELAPQ